MTVDDAQSPAGAAERLGKAMELPDFLRTAGVLSLDKRRLLARQALVLIEQNYVHLPLKAAMHAVNPVQRLRLLISRLNRQSPENADPEWKFHAELLEIFHSVRDLHTNYILPQPFTGTIAYLPYQVEEYFEGSQRRYVVTRIVSGHPLPADFGPGAEVTYWNGIPIDRAVDLNAARFAGSNAAARHSRGAQSLTLRPLRMHLPPDEEWVVLSYVGTDGTPGEVREKWRITENLPPSVNADELSTAAVAQGLDLDADETGRATKLLFAPEVVALEEAVSAAELTTAPAVTAQDVPTTMPGLFRARNVPTSSGAFGHIRIFSFNVDDPDRFVVEFVRLIGLLPQSGLIVDVRGNGGGHIYASEFLLQTLTPHRISPEPVQFIATPLNLRICLRHRDNPTRQIDLGPWCQSLEQAIETGATFSAAFPITPEDRANALGQRYHGPVVLITDARCYSATDIFAAGFADHRIGPVLGVDDNTGAGGANVWTHELLKLLLELPSADAESPYRPLPGQANMRVAIRRSVRVGALAGTPVEDLGVVPDERHHMTRDDVLHDNVDLLDRAGELLAAMPVRRLDVTVNAPGGTLGLDVLGLDRVDVYLDGRPRASADVSDGAAAVPVPGLASAKVIRVDGYTAGALTASRTIRT